MRRKSSWLSVVAATALSGAVYISATQAEGQEPLHRPAQFGRGLVENLLGSFDRERADVKRRLNREVAEHLRRYPPDDFGEQRLIPEFDDDEDVPPMVLLLVAVTLKLGDEN